MASDRLARWRPANKRTNGRKSSEVPPWLTVKPERRIDRPDIASLCCAQRTPVPLAAAHPRHFLSSPSLSSSPRSFTSSASPPSSSFFATHYSLLVDRAFNSFSPSLFIARLLLLFDTTLFSTIITSWRQKQRRLIHIKDNTTPRFNLTTFIHSTLHQYRVL
jgi:hypothetical protein